MRGQMMFPHRDHSMCGCFCEHSGMRGFITKESLSDYIQELKKEAQAAEETLSELGK